jgi:hypothetical protein
MHACMCVYMCVCICVYMGAWVKKKESVLPCVAVCCRELPCVAVCCSEFQRVAVWANAWELSLEDLFCVAVKRIVLHCVAVCCSVLQCKQIHETWALDLQWVTLYCSVLQRVAVQCSVLQRVVARCSARDCTTPELSSSSSAAAAKHQDQSHLNVRMRVCVRTCVCVYVCVCVRERACASNHRLYAHTFYQNNQKKWIFFWLLVYAELLECWRMHRFFWLLVYTQVYARFSFLVALVLVFAEVVCACRVFFS